jgi:hypothetical protein
MSILSELGFVFDTSIVGGLYYNTKQIRLDYRTCDESFMPFYPNMADARRISRNVEPIVCVPTNHFIDTPVEMLGRKFNRGKQLLEQKVNGASARSGSLAPQFDRLTVTADEWTNKGESGLLGAALIYLKRYVIGEICVSNISQLNYKMLGTMLAKIRREAEKRNLERVPVILASHTKDMRDFTDIEKFIDEVSKATDVRCVTLTQIADGLASGTYPIRRAA